MRKRSMKKVVPPKDGQSELRGKAEALLSSHTDFGEVPAEELWRLVHELEVHRMELELQNENLRVTQAELALSRDRFNELYDFAPVAYLTLSMEGEIREANLTVAGILGIERGRLLRQKLSAFLSPDCQDVLYHHLRLIAAGQGKLSCELLLRRPDGITIPVLVETIRFDNPAEGQTLFQSALIDITERKHAEERLRQSESFHRQVLESMPGLVFTTRPDGRRDYASGQWEAYTGMPLAQQLGDDWVEMVHPDDRQRVLAMRRQIIDGAASEHDMEYRLRRRDGVYEWFRVVVRPILGLHGQILRWFGIATHIERLKQVEQALRDTDRRKDEFLATLAHELRNPLMPIRNAAALLGEMGLDDPTLKWAQQVIEKHVSHICRLVDDLLDVSRIVGDKIVLKRESLDLSEVVRQAVETALPQVRAKGHRLQLNLPPEPVPWNGDVVRLTQVVANLLDNAVKYTPEGGSIEVDLTAGDRVIRLQVKDDGTGIAPELLPYIFDVFQQGERTLDRSQGGLGLGLTLVRELVERHGGEVEVSSPGPNQGATFIITLPAQPSPRQEKPASAPKPEAVSGRRVLVVDDEPDIAASLSMLLQLKGHQVKTAGDGMAALKVVSDFNPQVILVDIGLPGMDGFELARRLRAGQSQEAPPFVVAVSGYGDQHTQELALEAGFDRYLVKPVSATDLCALMEQRAH